MEKNEKSKKERLEKLCMVLDAPYNRNLHPEDEKYIEALRKRLGGSSKESIIYIRRSYKVTSEKDIDLLKPRVTIHQKEEKKSFVPVQISQIKTEEQKKSLYEDEDPYEVEKVEVEGPEFLEVKPKEIPKDEKPGSLEGKISVKKEEAEYEKHPELPEWEPVDIKKSEIEEKISDINQIKTELEDEQKHIEFQNEEIKNAELKIEEKNNEINQIRKELEDQLKDLELKDDKINSKEEEAQKLKTELHQIKKELDTRNEELRLSRLEIEETKMEKHEPKEELLPPVEKEETTEEKVEIEEEFFEEDGLDLEENIPLIEKREKEKADFLYKPEQAFIPPNLQHIPDKEKNDKIDVFKDIKSIDEKTAISLYDNGFTSIDAVRKASLKDLVRIGGVKKKLVKDIKREIEEKLVRASYESEDKSRREKFEEYFYIDEESEEEAKKIDENISRYGLTEETRGFFEEIKEDITPVKKDDKTYIFKGIDSIDEKTAALFYENGITSVDILRETSIKELTKIKGIKRKLAKKIKKEINKKPHEDVYIKKEAAEEFNDFSTIDANIAKADIKEFEEKSSKKSAEEEWNSYDENETPKDELKSYTYGDYALYKKEIETASGKKRTVHFFSKAEPEDGVPAELPHGFKVDVNKKTGVPYLKKKK